MLILLSSFAVLLLLSIDILKNYYITYALCTLSVKNSFSNSAVTLAKVKFHKQLEFSKISNSINSQQINHHFLAMFQHILLDCHRQTYVSFLPMCCRYYIFINISNIIIIMSCISSYNRNYVLFE